MFLDYLGFLTLKMKLILNINFTNLRCLQSPQFTYSARLPWTANTVCRHSTNERSQSSTAAAAAEAEAAQCIKRTKNKSQQKPLIKMHFHSGRQRCYRRAPFQLPPHLLQPNTGRTLPWLLLATGTCYKGDRPVH